MDATERVIEAIGGKLEEARRMHCNCEILDKGICPACNTTRFFNVVWPKIIRDYRKEIQAESDPVKVLEEVGRQISECAAQFPEGNRPIPSRVTPWNTYMSGWSDSREENEKIVSDAIAKTREGGKG